MKIDEYKTYQQNFNYMVELIQGGEHELLLVPVKEGNNERVALCTKDKEGNNVFPHAILMWANPHEILQPLLLDTPDEEDTPSPIITKL